MGFKVRGYTRDVPQEKVRDYSLFAIATEGTEREPDYFRLFDGIDRIKVDIIEPEASDEENAQEKKKASSPSKVLEKVKAYIAENQLSADDGDSLWCVILSFLLFQNFLLNAWQRGYEFLKTNLAHAVIEGTAQLIDFRLQQLGHIAVWI